MHITFLACDSASVIKLILWSALWTCTFDWSLWTDHSCHTTRSLTFMWKEIISSPFIGGNEKQYSIHVLIYILTVIRYYLCIIIFHWNSSWPSPIVLPPDICPFPSVNLYMKVKQKGNTVSGILPELKAVNLQSAQMFQM